MASNSTPVAWLVVIGNPLPALPTVRFVDVSKLSAKLKAALLSHKGDDISRLSNEDSDDEYDAFMHELTDAEIPPHTPEKVLRYYDA